MWKPLQNSPPYFMKCIKETEDVFYIGVTDFQRYWILNSSRKSFLADLKDCNEGIDFDDENELVEKGLDMLTNPESLRKVHILLDESQNLLTISMVKIYEFSLKLELGLLKASAEHFFQSVIQPLLQTVCDLRSSQHELRELLKKKDREIEEYKIEGRAPRRLITTVYDDAAHMMKHTTYEENFGRSDIQQLLEATACTGLKKNERKPQPKSAKETNKDSQGTQQTIEKCALIINSNEQVTVVKKSSQETPQEIASIIPTQIEETVIPESVIKTNEESNSLVVKKSVEPSPRKRPKTRLKY